MKNTRTEASVKNGVKILKAAIKKNISLSEASRQFNFGRNYVSDIKLRIRTNWKKKNITKESYTQFTSLLKQYAN